MTKREEVRILRSQRGMTLIEIMVGTGLVGIIFVALMSLLGKAGEFTSIFNRDVRTIEGVTEAVGALNAIIPQVTRIQSCNCRANSSTRANCVWNAANPWYDP